ncbi:hypothetical protein DFH09DRAFT_1464355 [Mycena vulgaris]|nr:hypothetical protein DFH09DRAFT_1464355 [Mycena vulgaris]
MSLTVKGASVTSFSYANISRTVLSPSFISRLGPSRPTGYLFTVTVGPSGSFSSPLHCTLGPQLPFNVVLGCDWTAHLRDCLLHYGFRLDSQFDAWKCFSYHLPPPPGPSAAAIPTPPAPIGPSPSYVHPAASPYYPAPFSRYGTYPPQPLMTASYFLSAPSFLVPTSYHPLARSQYSTSLDYPPSSTSSNANAISWYYPSNSSPSSTAGSAISLLRLCDTPVEHRLDMADDSDTYAMHRSQGLRRYTGWLFGEIDFVGVLDNEKGLCVRLCCPRDATCSAEALFFDQIEVLRETISVEEELEGGVLLESWFGSAFNTRVETKGNTFWLHVMAQSPGIYKILAKTFKVECVIKCKATLQRADIPNNSTNMIERSYALLSSTLRISLPGDVPCKGLGYEFKVANGKLRAGEAGDR